MNLAPHLLLTAVFLAVMTTIGRTHGDDLFRHDLFASVLQTHVAEARVDYRALKTQPANLDLYLEQIAQIPQEQFTTWPRDARLALLINLYNAQTLRLIADHYPVASIKKIGVLPGAAWRIKIVRFGGQKISLDDLEHRVIRKEYQEPRIHFALVCAALGCPPLRGEPYDPRRLHDQLDDQARRFLADPSKNRFDAATGTLWLSPIFEWFAADFTPPAASLVDYIMPYLPEDTRRPLANSTSPKVRFSDYDWDLNDRSAP